MKSLLLGVPAALGAAIGGAFLFTPQREQIAPRDMPGADQFVSVDGFTLHYTDQGPRNGVPVVLIHGFGSWAFTWRKERAVLARAGFRTLAFDMLGSGASDRPEQPIYTTELQAKLILGALTTLGINAAHLVGHSYGARVSMQIALLDPGRVRSLALLAPEALATARPQIAEWLKVPGIGYALAFYSTAPQLVGSGLKLVSKQHDWITPDVIAGYAAPLAVRGSAAAQVWQGRSPKDGARPVPQHLAEITAPTLIIWGGDDPVFPASDGTQLAHAMPNATLTTLPGVGHIPHEEAGERVSEILVDWLEEMPS